MGKLQIKHCYRGTTARAVIAGTRKKLRALEAEHGVRLNWSASGDRAWGSKSVASFSWAVVGESGGRVRVEVRVKTPFLLPIPSSVKGRIRAGLASVDPNRRSGKTGK